MRSDIKMLCVTNWNAVLELITEPYTQTKQQRIFNELLIITDPNAIDAGQVISLNEIKLVIRIKQFNIIKSIIQHLIKVGIRPESQLIKEVRSYKMINHGI